MLRQELSIPILPIEKPGLQWAVVLRDNLLISCNFFSIDEDPMISCQADNLFAIFLIKLEKDGRVVIAEHFNALDALNLFRRRRHCCLAELLS